ncbi:MAG: amidohydrolase family protein [Myxococcales bacterium]|nr:amidohydrolase family protein [Myxococcales bacterium]MCB9583114.1 amidohydrolase family protein [Polyangiaceae bacterium]
MSRRFLIVAALPVLALGCRSEAPAQSHAPPDASFVLAGATLVGVGVRDVEISGGRIVKIAASIPSARRIDESGRFLVPALIDSHVHLAVLPRAEELATGGVAAVVDLASPKSFLARSHAPLEVLASGPMITAPGGYPTQSWGQDGYGEEVSGPDAGAQAVNELFALGARVVKLPVTGPPVLDDATLEAVVRAAHAKGMKVATHALSDAEALRAAQAGADVLAHTPAETLSEETLAAWQGRAVISTLSAFGGSAAEANLAALRARGVTVLYGTDFGNTTVLGASKAEIVALEAAGLDGAAVLAAATRVPAGYWGFSGLGSIEAGKVASLLVLASDPTVDASVLSEPVEVYLEGSRR